MTEITHMTVIAPNLQIADCIIPGETQKTPGYLSMLHKYGIVWEEQSEVDPEKHG